MKSNIAAVVILYNPRNSVYKNIESYKDQVDLLFVYDNSEIKNFALIDKLEQNSSLIFIDNEVNKGVGEVLNNAAEKAIDMGCHYLLTMDQDSKAPKDLVKKLYEKAIESDKIGIVSPLHSNKFDTHLSLVGQGKNKVMTVMTSGNLLSLKAFKSVGRFHDDFFIDYIDIEYCIRMNYNNYDVIRINDIVLEHDEGNLVKRKFLSKIYFPINNSPIRWYYKTRNLFYLRKIYIQKYPYPLKIEYNVYLRNFIKMILFEKQRLQKLSMILSGVWDYRKGKRGRKY